MKNYIGFLLYFIILISFSISGSAQEDKFSYLIENGVKMIKESDFEKVLNSIDELPLERKGDFRIKVLQNFAYLKGYMVTSRREYGNRWKAYYNSMLQSGDKTATPILVELLKDDDPYVRLYTAKALGFIGDQRALEELKKVEEQDRNVKVRSGAKWAYEQLVEGKSPKKSEKKFVVCTIPTATTCDGYYHSSNCLRVVNMIPSFRKELSEREALESGYTPCPFCIKEK
jgi:hypothetical protein